MTEHQALYSVLGLIGFIVAGVAIFILYFWAYAEGCKDTVAVYLDDPESHHWKKLVEQVKNDFQ